MSTRELTIDVDGGHVTALDHGGPGPGVAVSRQVLLVHGSGHNAAAWDEVAPALTRDAHVVAVDLRGHGQSRASSAGAEQYWRDLATVVAALDWDRPVLVGHSTGGYAVTAVTAAGLVDPSALCVVDGFVLDERGAAARAHAAMASQQALQQLREGFGYGWVGSARDAQAAIQQTVDDRGDDWLNAGASAELVRAVAQRSYMLVPGDDSFADQEAGGADRWTRRPSLEEVSAVAAVDPTADLFPSVDIYDRLSCPMVAVLPAEGFYAPRRSELKAIIDADPQRELVDVAGGHNTVMTAPSTVSDIVSTLLRA